MIHYLTHMLAPPSRESIGTPQFFDFVFNEPEGTEALHLIQYPLTWLKNRRSNFSKRSVLTKLRFNAV